MPRKRRVEYAGAIYHIMCRGDWREDIFLDDVDRQDFLKTLAEAQTDRQPTEPWHLEKRERSSAQLPTLINLPTAPMRSLLFFCTLVFAAASLYPFSLGRHRVLAFGFPTGALIAAAFYQGIMKLTLDTYSVPIRVDYLFIFPAILFSGFALAVRVCLVLMERSRWGYMVFGRQRWLQALLLLPSVFCVVAFMLWYWN